jgi:hypothetical protein
MALLVPQIGEVESLRYLVGASNHIPDLEEAAPRNLILKLYSSNTTPADGDVPSPTAYYEPLGTGNTNAYGSSSITGYPECVNNRTDQDYTDAYGILLNGSRWVINKSGTATTATYPEQTFTFTGSIPDGNNAGEIYGYFLARANNMPVSIHGVEDAATVGVGTIISKGNNTNPTIGIVGNRFFTIDPALSVDDVTTGMVVQHITTGGNPVGISTGSKVVGVDRATKQIFIDKALEANIQVATGSTVEFSFSKVGATNHGLEQGDVIYIARGTGNTTTTEDNYTIHTVYGPNEFTTTPALDGTGAATLYSSIFYAERFTNGPYNIQNPGDQIKITLNVSLE